MEKRTARLTLLIDPDKKAVFEELCKQEDVTPSQRVRQFIREYVEERLGPDWREEREKDPDCDQNVRNTMKVLAPALLLATLSALNGCTAMPSSKARDTTLPAPQTQYDAQIVQPENNTVLTPEELAQRLVNTDVVVVGNTMGTTAPIFCSPGFRRHCIGCGQSRFLPWNSSTWTTRMS